MGDESVQIILQTRYNTHIHAYTYGINVYAKIWKILLWAVELSTIAGVMKNIYNIQGQRENYANLGEETIWFFVLLVVAGWLGHVHIHSAQKSCVFFNVHAFRA